MYSFFDTEEEANKKVLQYGNVLVTNRELQILKGPRFLNDIILEFYFLHISNIFLQSHESFLEDILLVSPALSFFLQQDFGDDSHIKDFAESNKVATKHVVMFTVNNNSDAGKNDGGSHWSLLVYYRKSNTFVHYDSLGTNSYIAKKLFRAVKKHVTTPAESSSTNTDATKINGDGDSMDTSVVCAESTNSNTNTITGVCGESAKRSKDGDTIMNDGDSTDNSDTDLPSSFTARGHRSIFGDENWLRPHDQKRKKKIKKQRMRETMEEKDMDMSWSEHKQYVRRYKEEKCMGYRKYGLSGFRDDPWNNFMSRGYQYHDEDDGFKEEECMPKQKNYYDCGLYVMEVVRVVCEWYYLDDEGKQQQPEHRGLWCKLGGGGRFPSISENVDTSLESSMRHVLLTIMQQRAQESGIHLDLFTSDDDEWKDVLALLSNESESKDDLALALYENESKDDESTLQFGPFQRCKPEDEKVLEDCGGVTAPPPQSVSSTSEDEPEEIRDPTGAHCQVNLPILYKEK